MTARPFDRWSRAAMRPWWLGRETVAPVMLLLLTLFLRTYRMALQAWIPDSYEQLAAAQRLVHGDFPISHLYPPGVALTMAPAFLFLPKTFASMQGVIIVASLALVAVCYFGTERATGDWVAAILVAGGVATAPIFVYFSRDGLFDVINAMWITLAIMLVPALRGRSPAAFALYGALLSIAINVRATDAAFLPALLIWWSGVGRPGVRLRDAIASALCRETITAGVVMVALSAMYAYLGGWAGHAASAAPLTLGSYWQHVEQYVIAEFGGALGAPFIVPLAALGAAELWRRDRALLFAALYMVVIWPAVHSPLPFANGRYMLPALVFSLLLGAHAPASVARLTAGCEPTVRQFGRVAVVVAVSMAAIYFAVADVVLLKNWPSMAAHSDEAAMRELRPVVATLPAGSLLVSPATRGVRESNPRLTYLDLIDYSLPRGNGPASVDAVLDDVARAQAAGRRVFYMHSRVEVTGDTFAQSGPGYEPYFRDIERRFGVTLVYAASVPDNALYEIDEHDTRSVTP